MTRGPNPSHKEKEDNVKHLDSSRRYLDSVTKEYQ